MCKIYNLLDENSLDIETLFKVLKDELTKLDLKYEQLGEVDNYESNLLMSEISPLIQLPVKEQLYEPFHYTEKMESSISYSYDPSKNNGCVHNNRVGNYLILYELSKNISDILRNIERRLEMAKGTIVKRIPHFERQFVDVFVVKMDNPTRKIEFPLPVSLAKNQTELNTTDNITGNMLLSASLQIVKNLDNRTVEIDFLYQKLVKGKQARIDLPFGKKLHARD